MCPTQIQRMCNRLTPNKSQRDKKTAEREQLPSDLNLSLEFYFCLLQQGFTFITHTCNFILCCHLFLGLVLYLNKNTHMQSNFSLQQTFLVLC